MRSARVTLLPAVLALLVAVAADARAEPQVQIPVDTIVPDVKGLGEAQVVAGLEAVYVIEVVEVPAPLAADGRVLAQQPNAGRRLPFRGTLKLEIGRAGLAPPAWALPRLVGLELAEAERVLLERGIVSVPVFRRVVTRRPGNRPHRPEVGRRTYSTVMQQDPVAGTLVGPEAQVALVVALPRHLPSRVRVPSLQGLTSGQAAEALSALGLTPRMRRMPSVFPQETVVEQIPGAGARVSGGSAVHLVVAIPAGRHHVPARVPVPDLRGARLAEAFELARAGGVRLQVRRRLAPEHAVDQVLAQRPTAGVRVPLGTVIRISLPVEATVPALLGLGPNEAAQRAAGADLTLVFEGDARRGPRARVVDQSPSAGRVVAAGTAVRAVLRGRPHGRHGPDPRDPSGGSAAQLVRVPDLTGLSLAEATRRLAKGGLVARPSLIRGSGAPGVTGQAPAPGSLVPRGSEVRLTVRR